MDTLTAQQKLIRLFDAGYSEALIVKETGIPQPTINRIKHGQEPRETYVRLIDDCYFRLLRDEVVDVSADQEERRVLDERRLGPLDRRFRVRRSAKPILG